MAITYSLAPNPHWVVIDNFSQLPIGAAIYTFSSLNPSQFKPAYQDAGGTIPYGQPIVGFANGTFPPIFWKFDTAAPNDLYYIEVWNKVIVPGGDAVLLWTFSGLSGSGSGGGGGTVTTNLDLENLVVNGEFYRNIGNQVGAPSIATSITLAPSNHDGFCGVQNNIGDGPPSPDIIFAKGDQSASDSLSFTSFPLGDSSFSTGGSPNQPTPQLFVNYSCTVAGSETFKYIQFPLVKGLQNLNNVSISVQMWNRYNGGDTNITLALRQFFGNGAGASIDTVSTIGSLNLAAGSWTKTQFTSFLVPSIAGKVIGNCGNDGLFLQIRFPSSVLINLDFILPAVYIGNTNSSIDFHSLDYVDEVITIPRTGDIRTSINSFHDYGWVPMNDGTIGSAASSATTRKNIDTFPLYDLIWNAIPDSLAPVSSGRGASSIADFGANKSIALTRNLGRVMAGALPISTIQAFTNTGNIMTVPTTTAFYTGMAVTITGGALPTPLVINKIYYAIVLSATTMSLATTTSNALAGTAIVLTTNASGTVVVYNTETLGSYIGEESHFQAPSEVGAHQHGLQYDPTGLAGGGVGSLVFNAAGSVNTKANTNGDPMPIIQPTVYMNVFVKL